MPWLRITRFVWFLFSDIRTKILFQSLLPLPLGIALPAGDGHLINWANNFLNTLKKSGELDKLRARWIEDGSWLNELP